MSTRRILIVTAIALSAANFSAVAASIVVPIEPNRSIEQGLQFNVDRRIDRASTQTNFMIEILAKDVPLPTSGRTWISLVQTDAASIEVRGVRRIDCDRQASHMQCDFAVSNSELENSDLSFMLETPVQVNRNGEAIAMPAMNLLYFRLNDSRIRTVTNSIDLTSLLLALWRQWFG